MRMLEGEMLMMQRIQSKEGDADETQREEDEIQQVCHYSNQNACADRSLIAVFGSLRIE